MKCCNSACFLLAALIGAAAPAASAQSLFPIKEANQALRGSSSADPASLFSDLRAHNVGDVLTITINENTTATATATTKLAQSDSVNVFGGTGLFSTLFGGLGMTAANSRTGTGDGSTARTGTLNTTLSVVVKEVEPNGVLKVQGTRVVDINKESQKVVFTGLVRPEDIGADNTVPSNLVANVKVRLDGKGVVAHTETEGILSRIFHFLF